MDSISLHNVPYVCCKAEGLDRVPLGDVLINMLSILLLSSSSVWDDTNKHLGVCQRKRGWSAREYGKGQESMKKII